MLNLYLNQYKYKNNSIWRRPKKKDEEIASLKQQPDVPVGHHHQGLVAEAGPFVGATPFEQNLIKNEY
jgi:hypothetical protein